MITLPITSTLTDLAAERGVLGCVLMAPSHAEAQAALDKAGIEPDHFCDPYAREVFGLLNTLLTDGEQPDLMHLDPLLKTSRADIGALRDFTTGLQDATPSFYNLEHYAEHLRGLRARREAVDVADSIRARALDLRGSVAEAQDLARQFADMPLVRKQASTTPFTVWRPSQFLSYVEPVGSNLLLPAYLTRGELTTLIGQPGLGKTRLALWLAICQITGRSWCGLDVHPEPTKWLFIGDENSISRWKGDIERMFSILTAEEIAKVEEYLRLPALAGPGDGDIWLGDPLAQLRLAATIEAESPGVIVADPLGNLAPDDISKPGPMKEAVRLILNICRTNAPDAAISLLHHARSGRGNIAQGVGWDAGNFASGGKALLGSARCQMNLMPGSADDDTRLVLSCAKCNNGPRFETRGLLFNTKSFTYSVDGDFNLDAWQADLEGKRSSNGTLCTIQAVVSAVRDGYSTTKDLKEHLAEACATSLRTAERIITKAVEAEGINNITRGKFILGKRSGKYLTGDAI